LAQKIFDLERSEKELKLKLADEEVKNLAFNQLKLEAEKKEKEIELLKKEKELEASEKDRLMQAMKLTEQQNKNLLKEQEIKNLEAQKSIQDMKIKQNEMLEKDRQKELALLQSETDKQKLKLEKNEQTKQKIRWIFLLGFIIFVIIIFALVLSIRLNRILALQKQQIQEKNEELNLQNEEIKAQKEYLESANEEINTQKQELFVKSELLEYKNNEITSSINYAQKIQFAILPLMNELKEDFPEFFILYKPKDIVSGDFYWTKKIGDYHVIAIADCTGHGVPGAFMSMLGVSFLNEIVSKTRFDSAAEVLNKLRNKVKQALRQKGGTKEQKDGMDISLIVLNKQDMTLQFAGANNSLLYISDNNLEILKADRMPIGIHHKEADFTNHNIKIKSGDTIYAFSDGYQDQFGGKSGRKFLSKNLRELLFSIKEKEISSQKGILENTLSTWMSHKNEEGEPFHQVDDIMIFGVKI
jgi:serine phosphatase RsbU (regulator of sigma subunit)